MKRLVSSDQVAWGATYRRVGVSAGRRLSAGKAAYAKRLALPSSEEAKRGRFAYIAQPPPFFNATLRASWLFFLRRGGSTRMNPDLGASLPPVRLGPR